MTKAQRREIRSGWNKALAAGRVVAIGSDGLRMEAYPSTAVMDAALAKLQAAGVEYRIVTAPKLAADLTTERA